ncbi:MAG: aspartate kinase [Planctomycetes bacterium]|nr:aspartate kinase [Planctomycetota bacterium]
MLIMKFGGRALATPERIRHIAGLIKQRLPQNPVVIISALAGVTDLLERFALQAVSSGKVNFIPVYHKHERMLKKLGLDPYFLDDLSRDLEMAGRGVSLLKELTPRTLDYIMSFGERMAARLFSRYLSEKADIPTFPLDAYDIGLKTDSNFGNARPLDSSARSIRKKLKWRLTVRPVPVITGFIGKDANGEITTLGRDGSDYTASFIGAALEAEEIQIWRDVPGVMTADPRLVKEASVVESISLNEASELVYYGTGVLHPYMLAPAVDKGIPVRILDIMHPKEPGTVISNRRHDKKIKTIAYKKNAVLVNVVSPEIFHHRRFVTKVFETLNLHGVFFHLLTSSEISVSFIAGSETPSLYKALKEIGVFARVDSMKNKAIICIIGEGIKNNQKAIGRIFTALPVLGVKPEMMSYNPLKTNMAFTVGNKDVAKTVRKIHNIIFN